MVLAAAAAAAPAAEIYVDAGNVSGVELGTQQSPYRTVQAAINAAGNGDEIRVAAGTYAENLRIEGKAVVLAGGYSPAWVRDVAANPTTLAGAGGDAVVNLIESDATIDGFRITGGSGSIEEQPYGYHGGGIYSRDGSPTISNNVIEGNDLRRGMDPEYNLGGGIHVSNAATATILDNVVRGNFGGRGAGISVVGPAARIQGNTVEGNVAIGDHGGGMFLAVVDALVTGNTLRGNEVGRALGYGWGGGLIFYGEGNYAEISYNIVTQNFAAAYGAGLFIDEGAEADIHHELIYRNLSKEGCEAVSAIAVDGGAGGGSRVSIRNCTVAGNVCDASIRGNGLQVEGASEVDVNSCIFWSNGGDDFSTDGTSTLRVAYTASQEAIDGTGNISVDPRFVDEAAADYRLAAGSPCVDAGDPAAPGSGGRVDMGRFERAADPPATDVPDDQDPGDVSDDRPTDAATGGDAPVDDTDAAANEDAADAASGEAPGGEGDADSTADGPQADPLASGAVCPMTAALLLSLSLVGARRCGRARPR